jgi:hypothetical protein
MAATITLLATRAAATSSAVATALGGGVTATDVLNLAKVLTVLALRPGCSVPLLSLAAANLEPQ